METLGDRLRALRKAKGLTQQELADYLGIAKSSISMYESGKHEPTINTLLRIADRLGVSIGTIIPSTPDYAETISFLNESGSNRLLSAYSKLDGYGKIIAVECLEIMATSKQYSGHSPDEEASLMLDTFFHESKFVTAFLGLAYMSNEELDVVIESLKKQFQDSSSKIKLPSAEPSSPE